MTDVTVIIEGPGRIEVYRPRDVREVLTWHEQRPCGVAIFNQEHQVWMVEQAGERLWCASRVTARCILDPPSEGPGQHRSL